MELSFEPVKKWTKKTATKTGEWVKGAWESDPRSIRQYTKIGHYFVSKKWLLAAILLLIVLILLLIFFPYSRFGRWQDLYENTNKAKTFTGNAQLYDNPKNKELLYRGAFVDGQYDGDGKIFLDQQVIYDGQFVKGQKQGTGSQFNDQGKLIYKGQFAEGRYSGTGIQYYDDGSIEYEGTFINQLRDGTGKLYNDRSMLIYEGQFNNNVFNGTGTKYNNNGKMIYTGAFQNGLYDGAGVDYNDKGVALYKGAFALGKRQGQGILYTPQGINLYEGTFLQGQYSGQGKLNNSQGEALYEGQFRNNKYDGIGTLYGKDKLIRYKGFFAKGQIDPKQFLGLSRKEVQNILGDPATIRPILNQPQAIGTTNANTVPVTPAAGTIPPGVSNDSYAAITTGAAAAPITPEGLLPAYLDYPDLHLIFQIGVKGTNATVSAVTLNDPDMAMILYENNVDEENRKLTDRQRTQDVSKKSFYFIEDDTIYGFHFGEKQKEQEGLQSADVTQVPPNS